MENAQAARPKAQHEAVAPPTAARGGPDAAEREAHAHGHALGGHALRGQARRPRHLRLVGLAILVLAAAAVAYGVISREDHEAALTRATDIAAVPVVALASPVHGTGPRSL
ncbi:MAG: hypothetical protein JO157_05215, partial [Acetobacteraceae bacterium]|nr:hypothetical protein [Acetobacteraceae bacterium]